MTTQQTGLLIGCALRQESAALERRLPGLGPIVATGMGVERTRAALTKMFRRLPPTLFVFTGTAGQLDPSVELGEVILPREWCWEGGSCFSIEPGLGGLLEEGTSWSPTGRGLTVGAPVLRVRSRLRLYREWGARICDMEAAAALEIAAHHDVPCLAPKVVSDTAESGLKGFVMGFERHMDGLADFLKGLVEYLDRQGRPSTDGPNRG